MSERNPLVAVFLTVALLMPCGRARTDPLEEEVLRGVRAPVAAVRRRAATLAGQRSLNGLVKELTRLLLHDEAALVRCAAARALGQLHAGSAQGALVRALADKDPNVRREAAWALGELHAPTTLPALLQSLHDPDYGVRDQAAYALSGMPSADLAAKLETAWREGRIDSDHASWLLKRLPAPLSHGIVNRLLSDKAPETRLRGLEGLLLVEEDSAASALVHALNDVDARIRVAAVRGLVKLHDYKARRQLRRRRAVETDSAVRAALEAALTELSREKTLVGYWPFENGGVDASGHGNEGQVIGCTSVPGKVGHALKFGPKQYVELGHPPALSIANHELTVMAWVQTDQPNGVVVARGGAFCGFSLYVKNHRPRFGIHRQEAGPAYIAAGKETVPAGWFHLAGVLRAHRLEVYVDGRLAGAAKTPGLIPGDCGQGMEIGADIGNSPAELTDPWVGLIDEVRVYQAALAPEEIAEYVEHPQQATAAPQPGKSGGEGHAAAKPASGRILLGDRNP